MGREVRGRFRDILGIDQLIRKWGGEDASTGRTKKTSGHSTVTGAPTWGEEWPFASYSGGGPTQREKIENSRLYP